MKFNLRNNVLLISLAVLTFFVGLSCVCAEETHDGHNYTLGGLDTPHVRDINDIGPPHIIVDENNVTARLKEIVLNITPEDLGCSDCFPDLDLNSDF